VRCSCCGGFVLSAAGQQASVSGSLVSSGHAFWYGILLACLIVWILPSWAGAIFFVIALIASDVLQSTAGHARFSGSNLLMLLILLIGLVIGLFIGRIRGLRHLGEYEFRNRWINIRTISRWL
jgi:hypothetical protein